MVTKVKLRQKLISGNRKSLYLDFYPPIPHPETGNPTRREFLGLYIFIKPKTQMDKQHNTDTIKIGESIRQKRENYLNKPEIYTQFEKEQLRIQEIGEKDFVEYFRKLCNKRKDANRDNWNAALKHLESFTAGNMKFAEVTESKMEEFKEHLLNAKSKRSSKVNISNNTAVSYFNKLKAALKQAHKDGFLQENLNNKIKPIKTEETRREYLTIEELNKLVETPCNNELLKRAALFSALTGLRFSDIQKLKWKEVAHIDGQGYSLNFDQKKTKGVEVLPISEQAVELMGASDNPEKQVFNGLIYSAYHNKHLFQWIGAAGITKDITFHCFRHTYAVIQLSEGTDIYTLSKMLGHRDLKTTQVYAKIVDKLKREAADKVKLKM